MIHDFQVFSCLFFALKEFVNVKVRLNPQHNIKVYKKSQKIPKTPPLNKRNKLSFHLFTPNFITTWYFHPLLPFPVGITCNPIVTLHRREHESGNQHFNQPPPELQSYAKKCTEQERAHFKLGPYKLQPAVQQQLAAIRKKRSLTNQIATR